MRSRYLRSTFIGALSTILLAGCAGSYKHTLAFNPSEPIRIAVLPFAQVDDTGKLIRADENFLIDNVALVSSKLKQTPAQFVQTEVQSELAKASLDIVTPAIVEAAFVHNGYTVPNTKPVELDLAKIFAASPQEICSNLVSCDAVLYGRVTEWDRSYYGVQSVATVGLELKLVSARSNKVLFETSAKDSDSRGLTKGPTGFSNIVLEPLKGLDNAIIQDLGREVADKAIEPLTNKTRPEYLQSAPPAIIASGHTASTGSIAQNGKLVVIAFATPGQIASFSVGNVARGIPMLERSPGRYIGEFIPLKNDSFSQQFVVVSLKDEFGRATSHKIVTSPVSYR